MRKVTREQVRALILRDDVPFDERVEWIKTELRVPIPPDIEDGEPLLDFVYNFYLKTLKDYEIETGALYRKENPRAEPKATKQDWIANHILANVPVSRNEVIIATDEHFADDYKEKGKTSRTRVRKTVNKLILDGIIWEEQGTRMLHKTKKAD